MRTTILAATAALVLALGTSAGFAAHGNNGGGREHAERSESSNVDNQCSNILAHASGHSASDVAYCRSK
jgi:hypothetical protein